MQKLSVENIQFIQNYLENSGVEYLDIRIEMTDHVASEIESRMVGSDSRDFDALFEEYMLIHKSDLLKSLKKSRKEADKKVLYKVLHNLYNWKTLTATTFFAMAMNFMAGALLVSQGWLKLFIMISIFGIYILPVPLLRKRKYIYTDRLIFIFGIILYLTIQLYDIVPYLQQYTPVCLTGFALIYISVVKTLLDPGSFYKKNHQVT